MRVLMLAFSCEQPYPVLRAAAAAGYSVHVLGQQSAVRLKYSRYCSSYRDFNFDILSGSLDEALAVMARRIKEVSADLVLPADAVSTRLLVALAGRLPVPTPALPDAACFDMLNDKWQFHRFCMQHGLNTPQTWLFEDVNALKTALAAEGMPFPVIVKPLDCAGGFGIREIKNKADLKILDSVQYKPLLAQKLIEVEELVDISILAHKGRTRAYAIQRNLPDKYQFIRHDKLLAQASRVIEESGFQGLAHFDAVVEKMTGDLYLLECNPRPWMSLSAATVAGLNFIKMSIDPDSHDSAEPFCLVDEEVDGSTRKLLKKVIMGLVKGRNTNKLDHALLKYSFADPLGKKLSRKIISDEYQIGALAALRAKTA